ncbi:MAG: nitrate ABC transporter ATP-binding protein [Deltaproteobacteria bacterium]|nr:MAG: nitrate ABC transporter ATP-binding protein [Deltaproteobacteria bacterium]
MHIACRHLHYTYPGADSPVFNNLDWTLEGPGFFALFGLSGTGKSTLARLISGELSPGQGEIDCPKTGCILYTHNAERIPGWGTVGAHLRSVTPASKTSLLSTILKDYGMEAYLESRFSGLSMGQKNRINFARYLVQEFDLLIADEVLANVDEPTRNHILERLKILFPQKTFLYISHNVLEVARFSQAVYVLPHASAAGTDRIHKITGLGHQEGREASEELVQERVYAILRSAASTSEPRP